MKCGLKLLNMIIWLLFQKAFGFHWDLEPGEQCEPTLLPTGSPASCCTATCQYSTAAQCATLNNKVDAAFMWDNALYLFQGDQVFRYTGRPADEANPNDNGIKPWNKVLDTGFPRPITTGFQCSWDLNEIFAMSFPWSCDGNQLQPKHRFSFG